MAATELKALDVTGTAKGKCVAGNERKAPRVGVIGAESRNRQGDPFTPGPERRKISPCSSFESM